MPFDNTAATPDTPQEPSTASGAQSATPEPQGPQKPSSQASEGTEPEEHPSQEDQRDEARHAANEEAKKYRLKAKELTAQVDSLTATVRGFQTAEVERIAAQHLASPSDLFDIAKKELDDFIGDDGAVNSDSVLAAVDELLAARAELRKPAFPHRDPNQGPRQPVRTTAENWGSVFAR